MAFAPPFPSRGDRAMMTVYRCCEYDRLEARGLEARVDVGPMPLPGQRRIDMPTHIKPFLRNSFRRRLPFFRFRKDL